MNTNDVYRGNIMICTKYKPIESLNSSVFVGNYPLEYDSFGYIEQESKIYKKNTILIKVDVGKYVEYETYKSKINQIKIKRELKSEFIRELILPTYTLGKDSLFVDQDSLVPYFKNDQNKEISVMKLKKEINKRS